MAENETDEETDPAVELGTGPDVDGVPLAQVTARLTWPAAKSDVVAQEGDATIRTPDGPQTIESILADSDEVYFDTRKAFIDAVENVIGTGPVATE